MKELDSLVSLLSKSHPGFNVAELERAYEVAENAHSGQQRKSGEPYIFHPIAVAQIVAGEIGLGTIAIVCALLHDTVEDTHLTLDDIEKLFGKKVAVIIDGLTKISGVFYTAK